MRQEGECMSHVVTRSVTGLSFLLCTLVFLPTPAAAQDPGIRGGISIDPDQFYFGGHLETPPLIDRLFFRPNLEIGLGDDLVLIAANMEFIYKFPPRSNWSVYAGAGPALNIFMYDDVDEADTEGGLNIMVGVEQSQKLFFEFKIGAIDSPDFKFGVGWTFR